MPFFFIITPTHKRADKLQRAIHSVLSQEYTNFLMIIINDSPEDSSYGELNELFKSENIIYLKNDKNHGVNYSRNKALEVAENKDIKNSWIIFLDDDDYLNEKALSKLTDLINEHKDINWFLTNRAYNDGKSLTKAVDGEIYYYAKDYLIMRNIKGDATHCIKVKSLNNAHFAKNIKQAEEWLFFFKLGLKNKIFYRNINTTLTDGYSEGLNFRKRTVTNQLKNISNLIKEGRSQNMSSCSSFLIYIVMRTVRAFVKHN